MGGRVNATPRAESRWYSAARSDDSNAVAGMPCSKSAVWNVLPAGLAFGSSASSRSSGPSGRDDRDPAVGAAHRYVSFLLEAEHLRVEAQRLLLIVDHDAVQFDPHGGDRGTRAAVPACRKLRGLQPQRRHQADAPRGRCPRGRLAPVRRRRDPDAAPEQVAETSGAREADLQAGVGDANARRRAAACARSRRTLDPKLVGRDAEQRAEVADQMEGREADLAGEDADAPRSLGVVFNQTTRSTQTLEGGGRDDHATSHSIDPRLAHCRTIPGRCRCTTFSGCRSS